MGRGAGTGFAHLKVAKETKENLGRPGIKPYEVKERLMAFRRAPAQEENNDQKAVIVAAGLSSRLYPLTLETQDVIACKREPLAQVHRDCQRKGVTEIAVVTGYKREMITRAVEGKAKTIPNPFIPIATTWAPLVCQGFYRGRCLSLSPWGPHFS